MLKCSWANANSHDIGEHFKKCSNMTHQCYPINSFVIWRKALMSTLISAAKKLMGWIMAG